MTTAPLAAPKDVADALGRDLTPEEQRKIVPILAKASALFRLKSGQLFTPGTSTVRLKSDGGRIYLPQGPVTAVAQVTTDDHRPVHYSRQGQWLTTKLSSSDFVRVTYSHGSDEVPDLVRLTIADIGRKVLSISEHAAAGVTQYSDTTGPWTESYSYATWAVGGQTMLAPDDMATAVSFRRRVPRIWVGTV